jgi:hypothetical protein
VELEERLELGFLVGLSKRQGGCEPASQFCSCVEREGERVIRKKAAHVLLVSSEDPIEELCNRPGNGGEEVPAGKEVRRRAKYQQAEHAREERKDRHHGKDERGGKSSDSEPVPDADGLRDDLSEDDFTGQMERKVSYARAAFEGKAGLPMSEVDAITALKPPVEANPSPDEYQPSLLPFPDLPLGPRSFVCYIPPRMSSKKTGNDSLINVFPSKRTTRTQ